MIRHFITWHRNHWFSIHTKCKKPPLSYRPILIPSHSPTSPSGSCNALKPSHSAKSSCLSATADPHGLYPAHNGHCSTGYPKCIYIQQALFVHRDFQTAFTTTDTSNNGMPSSFSKTASSTEEPSSFFTRRNGNEVQSPWFTDMTDDSGAISHKPPDADEERSMAYKSSDPHLCHKLKEWRE